MGDEKSIAVNVALRARPLVQKEILEGCQNILSFTPGESQVVVGESKAFTFDYAFPCDCPQKSVYDTAVASRIDYLFKGYNVTVLAYGQTGSGKTHTMGTSYSTSAGDVECNYGIIQRAVDSIFDGINERLSHTEFIVKVSFLEVYKEDIYDLLQKSKDTITIREDQDGIKIVGLTEKPVTSALETYSALEQGSLCRTTASTSMNAGSSRSHAIFTITLEQRSLVDTTDVKQAKFHLVDLAGSERANKTGAFGERFKEGVNINRGLLALGNVISSLCDESSHVPYRDSKLTRLLQDSLGGNSHTVMIACVSPADSNLDETMNTLRYADRARKIKNKPIVNLDPQNAELQRLKQRVQQLQMQLLQNGKSISPVTGMKQDKDMKVLLDRNKHLETENQRLAKALQDSLDQITALCEKAWKAEISQEKLGQKLEELKNKANEIMEALLQIFEDNPDLKDHQDLLKEWQSKLVEVLCHQARKGQEFSIYSPSKKRNNSQNMNSSDSSTGDSDEDCSLDDAELNEPDENFHKSTLKQAAMSRELQELDQALALKQELASKIKESDSGFAAMRIQYECSVKQMESEINVLQKEKEELVNALKAAKASSKVSKVSEQRRIRLQELEAKISEMKKQIQDKSRLVKMKHEAEHKVNNLTKEIQDLKSARVKLLKQIRGESERYRVLKVQKDREVAQLKQKDRKRQYEMCRLKDEFQKQKNVLKRKMEEASAANKRLNVALKQQKTVAERRAKEKGPLVQGIGSRIEQWLSQEMEVVLSSREAQHHLTILMDDRKTIMEQLNLLKNAAESSQPPRKKMSHGSTDEETTIANEQIESLEKELKIRNLQISEFQAQILDADQDEKVKERWENILSMLEAKCAMKWLFKSLVDSKFSSFLQENKAMLADEARTNEIDKLKSKVTSTSGEVDRLTKQLCRDKDSYMRNKAKLMRKSEDTTIYLMKQLQSVNVSIIPSDIQESIKERLDFMDKEVNKLSYLNDELNKRDAEIVHLRKQLVQADCSGTKNRLPMVSNFEYKKNPTERKELRNKSHAISHSDSVSQKRKKCSGNSVSAMEDFLIYESEDGDSEKDDTEHDPDWRLTPLLRQSRYVSKIENDASVAVSSEVSKTEKDSSLEEPRARKISSSGCNCKVSCSTKRCKCRKGGLSCGEDCKCGDTCCNRANDENDIKDSTSSLDFMNTTYISKNTSVDVKNVLGEMNSTFTQNVNSDDDNFEIKKEKLNLPGGIKKRPFHGRSQKRLQPIS